MPRDFTLWLVNRFGDLFIVLDGGTGLDQLFSDGYRSVAETVSELTLFKMLDGLPFTGIVSTISVS